MAAPTRPPPPRRSRTSAARRSPRPPSAGSRPRRPSARGLIDPDRDDRLCRQRRRSAAAAGRRDPLRGADPPRGPDRRARRRDETVCRQQRGAYLPLAGGGLTGALTIATTAATPLLSLRGNAAGAAAEPTTAITGLNITVPDGSTPAIALTGYGTNIGGCLYAWHADGTAAAPGATASLANLFSLRAGGYDGSSWLTSGAAVMITRAANAWSPTDHSAHFIFWTTPLASTTLLRAMTLEAGRDAVPRFLGQRQRQQYRARNDQRLGRLFPQWRLDLCLAAPLPGILPFGNTMTIAPPAYPTASGGARISLWSGASASKYDYALGVASNVLWSGVAAGSVFSWYGDNREYMRLLTAGQGLHWSETPLGPPRNWSIAGASTSPFRTATIRSL